jgi:uncharacterized protein YcaQ
MSTPRFDHILDLAVQSEDALNFAEAEAHLNSAVTAAIKGTNSHQLLVAYYRFGAYLRRQGRHEDADAMEKMAEVCAKSVSG